MERQNAMLRTMGPHLENPTATYWPGRLPSGFAPPQIEPRIQCAQALKISCPIRYLSSRTRTSKISGPSPVLFKGDLWGMTPRVAFVIKTSEAESWKIKKAPGENNLLPAPRRQGSIITGTSVFLNRCFYISYWQCIPTTILRYYQRLRGLERRGNVGSRETIGLVWPFQLLIFYHCTNMLIPLVFSIIIRSSSYNVRLPWVHNGFPGRRDYTSANKRHFVVDIWWCAIRWA